MLVSVTLPLFSTLLVRGKAMAASVPRIAITTSISMRVKPLDLAILEVDFFLFIIMILFLCVIYE